MPDNQIVVTFLFTKLPFPTIKRKDFTVIESSCHLFTETFRFTLNKKNLMIFFSQVELSTLQNKHKAVEEDSSGNRQQLDVLQQKYAVATRQVCSKYFALMFEN